MDKLHFMQRPILWAKDQYAIVRCSKRTPSDRCASFTKIFFASPFLFFALFPYAIAHAIFTVRNIAAGNIKEGTITSKKELDYRIEVLNRESYGANLLIHHTESVFLLALQATLRQNATLLETLQPPDYGWGGDYAASKHTLAIATQLSDTAFATALDAIIEGDIFKTALVTERERQETQKKDREKAQKTPDAISYMWSGSYMEIKCPKDLDRRCLNQLLQSLSKYQPDLCGDRCTIVIRSPNGLTPAILEPLLRIAEKPFDEIAHQRREDDQRYVPTISSSRAKTIANSHVNMTQIGPLAYRDLLSTTIEGNLRRRSYEALGLVLHLEIFEKMLEANGRQRYGTKYGQLVSFNKERELGAVLVFNTMRSEDELISYFYKIGSYICDQEEGNVPQNPRLEQVTISHRAASFSTDMKTFSLTYSDKRYVTALHETLIFMQDHGLLKDWGIDGVMNITDTTLSFNAILTNRDLTQKIEAICKTHLFQDILSNLP